MLSRAFDKFFDKDSLGGLLLMLSALAAMLVANSAWQTYYDGALSSTFAVTINGDGLSKPLILWINDGLMAIFFFVVGLEIKREILASKRLKSLMAANPRDLDVLRHDSGSRGVRRQAHLSHVPDYMVPESLRGSLRLSGNQRKRRRLINKTWLPSAKRRAKDPLAGL